MHASGYVGYTTSTINSIDQRQTHVRSALNNKYSMLLRQPHQFMLYTRRSPKVNSFGLWWHIRIYPRNNNTDRQMQCFTAWDAGLKIEKKKARGFELIHPKVTLQTLSICLPCSEEMEYCPALKRSCYVTVTATEPCPHGWLQCFVLKSLIWVLDKDFIR